MTLIAILITVAASIIAAAVVALLVMVFLTSRMRRTPASRGSNHVDNDYREARRAMNDAAGQSWRNLVD